MKNTFLYSFLHCLEITWFNRNNIRLNNRTLLLIFLNYTSAMFFLRCSNWLHSSLLDLDEDSFSCVSGFSCVWHITPQPQKETFPSLNADGKGWHLGHEVFRNGTRKQRHQIIGFSEFENLGFSLEKSLKGNASPQTQFLNSIPTPLTPDHQKNKKKKI